MNTHKRTSTPPKNGADLPLQEISAAAAIEESAGMPGMPESEIEGKLDQTLRAFKMKAARQIAYELPRITAKLLEEAAADFRRRAAELADDLRQELRSNAEQAANDSRAGLQALAADSSISFAAKLKDVCETELQGAASSLNAAAQAATTSLNAAAQEATRESEQAREKALLALQQSGAAFIETAEARRRELQDSISAEAVRAAKSAAEKAAAEALWTVQEHARLTIAEPVEAAVARLGAEQQKLQSQVDKSLAAAGKELRELSDRGAEGIQQKIDERLDAFRARLRESAEALQQKAIDEAAREFPRAAATLIEGVTGEMRNKLAEAVGKAKDEVRSSASSAADEAKGELVRRTEDELTALRESLLEQTKSQLRQVLKDGVVESRKEAEKEIAESLRKSRSSAQAQLEELSRSTLERARAAGAAIAPGPARSSRAGKVALVIIALLPAILMVYLISRPVMRLRTDPLADFVNAYPEWTGAHPTAAARLGAAYWDWAALHLTESYPYGSQLPDQPPAAFSVEGQGFPTGVDADVARMRYWQKLRELWSNPQSWQKIDRWNLH